MAYKPGPLDRIGRYRRPGTHDVTVLRVLVGGAYEILYDRVGAVPCTRSGYRIDCLVANGVWIRRWPETIQVTHGL